MPWPVSYSMRWSAPPVPSARAGRCRRPGCDRGRCRARSGGQLHQFHQQGRAGAAALVVIVAGAMAGVVLDDVVSSTSSISKGGPVSSPWLRPLPWPVPCSIRWPAPTASPARAGRCCCLGRDHGWCLGGCRARSDGQLHQFRQQGRAGAVALVVIMAGVLAGAVLTSSNRSTSKAGPVLLPWS